MPSSGVCYREYQDEPYEKSKLNKEVAVKLLDDPFCCGAYRYGKNYANLYEIYNFVLLVVTDEHIVFSKNTADTFQKEYAGRTANARRLESGILREKVICDFCDSIMGFQRTKLTEKAYKQYVSCLEEQLKVDKAIAQRKIAEARFGFKKEQNSSNSWLNLFVRIWKHCSKRRV